MGSVVHPFLRMLALAALGLAAAGPGRAAEPSITPRPLRADAPAGAPVRLGDGTPVVAPACDAEAGGVARYLIDLARRTGGPRLAAGAPHDGTAIRFVRRPGLPSEGYTLDVDGAGATVTASDRAGLFYGAVSLWQLLVATRRGDALARVHVEDAPRFRWRGLLLDSVRHRQSPAEITRLLDAMAALKLNRLQWHLTDDQGWRLPVPGYPRLAGTAAWRAGAWGLGRYGGVYTPAQIRGIVAQAAARNITVVPEIEMPGHATAAILAYPQLGFTSATRANLGDWGVFPSIYGVDARAFAFLHAVLDETMALFPSREIATGGDEAVHAGWHAAPAVQARMRALGLQDEAALQAWFVRQIGSYLNAHGRRLVGWDEILAGGPLPRDDIVLSWHGADGAVAAARSGHDVVMATAPTLYFDNRQSRAPSEPPGRGTVVSLADVYGYDPGNPPHAPGAPALDAAIAGRVIGVQGALWSEYIATDAQLEAMALPRAAALAEIGWAAAQRRDWPGFTARLPATVAAFRALGLRPDAAATPALTNRRVSQQLEPCTDKVTLNLPGRADAGPVPTYLVDILNPCWIDRGVTMAGVTHVAVSVAALPFNYQFADQAAQVASVPVGAGTLVLRRGCDGPVLASAPLAGLPRDGRAHELMMTIPAQTGAADLCLTAARGTSDPLWVLGWMEPRA